MIQEDFYYLRYDNPFCSLDHVVNQVEKFPQPNIKVSKATTDYIKRFAFTKIFDEFMTKILPAIKAASPEGQTLYPILRFFQFLKGDNCWEFYLTGISQKNLIFDAYLLEDGGDYPLLAPVSHQIPDYLRLETTVEDAIWCFNEMKNEIVLLNLKIEGLSE